ncbi:MAG: hypothetical protein AB7P08_01795 [Burkholderiales bacterium]
MNSRIRILAAAILVALAPLAAAQDVATNPGQSRVAARLASSFATVAGSRENALALVNALRNGTEVTLLAAPEGGAGDPVATTFTPPTKPMGWGNVSHSLALAQDSLARLGIANPTSADLQAALLGGEVTGADGSAVSLRGILQMRADGMGWGQIAKASGTTMGAVASSAKAMQGRAPAAAPTTPVAPAKPEAPTGITTADGSTTGTSPALSGKSARGITTATGASAGGVASGRPKGITTAQGAAAGSVSRGVVTADGSLAGSGRANGLTTAASGSGGGHAYGRGLVTASGASAGSGAVTASSHGRGAGVVAATGAAVSAGAVTAAGPGNGQGRGNGNGNGNGKGKGG